MMQAQLKKLNYHSLEENELKQNSFSLEVALRMSLSMLPNDDTGAKDLLYFLGCLPGGIRNDWLSQMWDMTAM